VGSPHYLSPAKSAMMKFNEQDRSGVVTLSAGAAALSAAKGKGLSRWANRCFAALSMTVPVLGGIFHHRATTKKLHFALHSGERFRDAFHVQADE